MPALVEGKVDEQAWWKDHPEPQVTRTDDRLVLWNYRVGKTELSDVHAQALSSFPQILPLAVGSRARHRSTVSICGHASATGERSLNDSLARERAENVATYLRDLGLQNLEVSSAGSSEPLAPAPSGQALARTAESRSPSTSSESSSRRAFRSIPLSLPVRHRNRRRLNRLAAPSISKGSSRFRWEMWSVKAST